MDCQNVNEAAKMASELYREAISVPFMSKFVVFAKRHAVEEARLRVFCMTDDKMDKTLENQEHFSEVARSRDVEVSLSCFVSFQSILCLHNKNLLEHLAGRHANCSYCQVVIILHLELFFIIMQR